MGVDPRSITTWVKKHADFPSKKGKNGVREFPVKQCLQWQRDRIVADAIASYAPQEKSDREDADLRKAIADAELAEIKVARERASVVAVGTAISTFRELATRIRAAVLSKRGEYRDEMLNLTSLAQTDEKLGRLVDEILEELQASIGNWGDLPDDDDEADTAGPAEEES